MQYAHLIVAIAYALSAAAMTLLCVGLLVWRLPKMFSSSSSWLQRMHDALLLICYLIFPLHIWVIQLAVAGTLGDGNTSTLRYVSRTTLQMVPIVQIALFLLWVCLRLGVRSLRTSRSPNVLFGLSGLLPVCLWVVCIFV